MAYLSSTAGRSQRDLIYNGGDVMHNPGGRGNEMADYGVRDEGRT